MNVNRYNQIVDQYADGLYRFAYSMCRDKDDAQDVVQDSFAKLWEKKDSVDVEKVKSYLFTTAHNKMIDMFRKNKRSIEFESQVDMVRTTKQENHDIQAVLHEALNTLPDIQKSVILMRDYEGYSYEEIAEMCNINLTQVKVYIFRGRQKLKNYIGRMDLVL
ncbi:MAG: RNA polymerase sigma factor [Flavobacteriales bacterium]